MSGNSRSHLPRPQRVSLTACFALLLISLLACTEVEPGKKFLLLKGLFGGIRHSGTLPERSQDMVRKFAETRLAAYTRAARLLHRLNRHFSTIGKRPRTEAIRRKEISPRDVRPIQRFQSHNNVVLRKAISSGWIFPPIVESPIIQKDKQMGAGKSKQPSPGKKKNTEPLNKKPLNKNHMEF